MKFKKGDRLEVSRLHNYCYKRSPIWVYEEQNGRFHTLTDPKTGERYNRFLTETLDDYFKLARPLQLENK